MRRAGEKLRTLDAVAVEAAAWRREGLRLALTNGCFDWLHAGHLTYLEEARALADRLVVGVNDDSSVRRLKGAGRPLLPAAERALLVAGLECVDRVVVFDDLTAEELIRRLRPHLYVKGADYDWSNLPEAAAARQVGCEVRFLVGLPGRSTSALLAAVRRERGGPGSASGGGGSEG